MFQQLLALIIIAFFIARLGWQKKNNQIKTNEFVFWLFFWILAAFAILFIKQIDALVSSLGFSGTGIDILFYVAVILLFYLVFKLRLKIEKIDRNITKIAREIAFGNNENDEQNKE